MQNRNILCSQLHTVQQSLKQRPEVHPEMRYQREFCCSGIKTHVQCLALEATPGGLMPHDTTLGLFNINQYAGLPRTRPIAGPS